MMRGARSAAPVLVASTTQPVVSVLAGPGPFKTWTVDRVDVSHLPLNVIMPVALYLNAVGPGTLIARATQGALNRGAIGSITMRPGDNLIAVWTPSSSTPIGTACYFAIEYEQE